MFYSAIITSVGPYDFGDADKVCLIFNDWKIN